MFPDGLQMQRRSKPTVHVDAFLYDEDLVDSLCEDGTLSRSYCRSCGSWRTAPLGESFFTTIIILLGPVFQCPAKSRDRWGLQCHSGR